MQAHSALPRAGSNFSPKLVRLLLPSCPVSGCILPLATFSIFTSFLDWDRLSVNLETLLMGKLKDSPTVTASFSAATKHLQKSDDLGPWIAGMFEVKTTPGAWDGWDRDMSYCEPYLTKFLVNHVWV